LRGTARTVNQTRTAPFTLTLLTIDAKHVILRALAVSAQVQMIALPVRNPTIKYTTIDMHQLSIGMIMKLEPVEFARSMTIIGMILLFQQFAQPVTILVSDASVELQNCV
jgi:hypothetical protein